MTLFLLCENVIKEILLVEGLGVQNSLTNVSKNVKENKRANIKAV